MLPPVDDAVLQNNPQFAALYKTLTTAVLKPNGSTKNDPAPKEREAVREELKKHRLKTTKHHLLISTLSTATPSPDAPKPTLRRPLNKPQPQPPSSQSLPPELLDLLILLPPLLKTPSHALSRESTALLLSNPPFTLLPSLLALLTQSISSSVVSTAATLARMLNPSTNPSFIHRAVPTLPTSTSTLVSTLQSQKTSLSRERHETATHLTHLLSLHAAGLDQLIRSLESKHGNLSRNLELRAAEIALSARRQEYSAGNLLAAVRKDVYTPAATAALERYARHLRDGKARLREEIAGLGEELGRYGVDVRQNGEGDGGRERTMREMARVYRDMNRQVEEVRGDLERLGRA